MYLKRLWEKDKNGKPTKVSGVRVLRAKKIEHWSPSLIETGIAEGWLSASAGKFVVDGEGEKMTYRVVRAPGTYSCFTGEKLGGEAEAKAHVAAVGKGKPSPDPSNPAGYRVDNFYTVVSDEGHSELSDAELLKMHDAARKAVLDKLAAHYRKAS